MKWLLKHLDWKQGYKQNFKMWKKHNIIQFIFLRLGLIVQYIVHLNTFYLIYLNV